MLSCGCALNPLLRKTDQVSLETKIDIYLSLVPQSTLAELYHGQTWNLTVGTFQAVSEVLTGELKMEGTLRIASPNSCFLTLCIPLSLVCNMFRLWILIIA